MSRTIVPPSFFLPFDAVKLGRFITNIDQPHETYHEPPTTEAPTSIVDKFFFTGENQNNITARFWATVTSLMSTTFSRRARSRIHIAPAHGTNYSLDNSEEWFDRAVSLSNTRSWIESRALRGCDIYMIVGITTFTDAHLVLGADGESQVGGQINVPASLSLAAASVIAPLAGLIDPAIHGGYHNVDSAQLQYIAPGEQVCAFKYRKVQYHWLSRRLTKDSPLSKTRQWLCMEGDRRYAYEVEDEDDEDTIEVGLEDMDNLDGEWEVEEVPGGEVVCIRS